MEDKLKILAQWLKNMEPSDFGYSMYRDGKLEDAVTQSQIEVCNKIGDYIEEILIMDSEQIKNEL